MAGEPKAPFYVVMALVIAGLVAFAAYRADVFAPAGRQNHGDGPIGDATVDPSSLAMPAEADDAGAGVTTVKEYSFKPSEKLPPPVGVAAYKPMQAETVRFALNVWAGWGPIILANEGFKAGKIWKTPDGKEFKIELVLIDNPVQMRDAYASGDVHIGWATLDMMPLIVDGFVDAQGKPRDSRAMPRIFQQVDWSNGGDGIVVRESIKTVKDLKGKKIVLAQNSPSHYFLLNMLVAGGLQPSEMKDNLIFTNDAFQAAAAFQDRPEIAACVSWAPDIYKLAEVKGNRMLVNTQTANKLIADVWFARADFAQDHPGIIESITRGVFDAMQDLKDGAKKKHAASLMSAGYNIPADEVEGMFGDAHSTNWGENYQFFINQNNPTNFERIWNSAYYLYRRADAISNKPVPFDQVMDFSVIEKLGKEPKYKSQQDEYRQQFVPKSVSDIKAEAQEILTNTVFIRFFPNNWDLHRKIIRHVDGKDVEELYDPNVDATLEEIAKLVGTFGAAQVKLEGHTDASMKGSVDPALIKELAANRANAVKEALVEKFKLDPNQFTVEGVGWDRPADANDPNNHAKNRRVEIRVYALEQAE